MNAARFDSATTFLLANARLLERRLFAFRFEGASAQPVLHVLQGYQNVDGGFGHALEPDKRCAESQPVDQEVGLRVLDEIGFVPEIAGEVCRFLQSITRPDGGVPFTLPTVRSAPHAPWWNTDDETPPASVNPTAGIAGLLHKNGFRHPWLDAATDYCWREIEVMAADEMHNLQVALTFLQHVPDRSRAERAFDRLTGEMMTTGIVALDPAATGYVLRPLDLAPTPQHPCSHLFSSDVIKAHLDALEARQQEDGGWPIAWPAVSPACEMEYRGVVTLGALRTLLAYGRV